MTTWPCHVVLYGNVAVVLVVVVMVVVGSGGRVRVLGCNRRGVDDKGRQSSS